MDNYYKNCLTELYKLIPEDDKRRILTQPKCEYEYDFMGFISQYKALSEIIPKDKIVLDFGCYLAAQSYYFKDHKRYIGIDLTNLKRFCPDNAEHYVGTIQDFIKENFSEEILKSDANYNYFAICNFVNDFEASGLVRKTFKNVFCYYPS